MSFSGIITNRVTISGFIQKSGSTLQQYSVSLLCETRFCINYDSRVRNASLKRDFAQKQERHQSEFADSRLIGVAILHIQNNIRNSLITLNAEYTLPNKNYLLGRVKSAFSLL